MTILFYCAFLGMLMKVFLAHLQKWHPDKHNGEEFAKAKFQEINEAYRGSFFSSSEAHLVFCSGICFQSLCFFFNIMTNVFSYLLDLKLMMFSNHLFFFICSVCHITNGKSVIGSSKTEIELFLDQVARCCLPSQHSVSQYKKNASASQREIIFIVLTQYLRNQTNWLQMTFSSNNNIYELFCINITCPINVQLVK